MAHERFSFDTVIFSKIFLLVMGAWKQKSHLYAIVSEASAPQNVFCPKEFTGEGWGSPSHIRWLAISAMSDSRTQSKTLYRGMKRLWDTHRFLFETNEPCSVGQLETLFREKGIGVPRVAIARFLVRRDSLWKYGDGDILSFFRASTVSEVLKNMKGYSESNRFPGVGPKIVSLITVFLTEIDAFRRYGVTAPKDFVPVDVWLQAIALSTQSFVVQEGLVRSSVLEQTLRPEFSRLMETHGICGSEVSHAFWLLGNQLCASCHKIPTEDLCPVYVECKGPIDRATYWAGGIGGWKRVRFMGRPPQTTLF